MTADHVGRLAALVEVDPEAVRGRLIAVLRVLDAEVRRLVAVARRVVDVGLVPQVEVVGRQGDRVGHQTIAILLVVCGHTEVGRRRGRRARGVVVGRQRGLDGIRPADDGELLLVVDVLGLVGVDPAGRATGGPMAFVVSRLVEDGLVVERLVAAPQPIVEPDQRILIEHRRHRLEDRVERRAVGQGSG